LPHVLNISTQQVASKTCVSTSKVEVTLNVYSQREMFIHNKMIHIKRENVGVLVCASTCSCTHLVHVLTLFMYSPCSCTHLVHVLTLFMCSPCSCAHLVHVLTLFILRRASHCVTILVLGCIFTRIFLITNGLYLSTYTLLLLDRFMKHVL